MRRLLIVFIILAVSCHHPVPVPVPPPVDGQVASVPDCPTGIGYSLPVTEDLCGDNFFTSEDYPCARCPSYIGCRDTVDMVYCVVGNCLLDSRCSKRGVHSRRK